LLEVRYRIDPSLLDRAVHHLLLHHDALRLRFVRDEAGWRQNNAGDERRPVVTQVDLTALPAAQQGAAITAAAAALQVSLDLAEGPIIRGALFELGGGQSGRLLLVIHQLAVDNASWH